MFGADKEQRTQSWQFSGGTGRWKLTAFAKLLLTVTPQHQQLDFLTLPTLSISFEEVWNDLLFARVNYKITGGYRSP